MQCNANQDINQIISSFELFIKASESSHLFLQTHTSEEIKNCFKLANSIEQIILKFQSKNTTERWMEVLDKYFKDKNSSCRCYNIEFFSTACDHLLNKFFEHKSTDVNMIDIAIRMYTALLPKKRFQKFLSNLLMKSASYKAILDFILVNENSEDRSLEYKLVLNNWTRDYKMGKSEELALAINEMLKFSKVEKSLHILIGVLTLEDISEEENICKTLILDIILKKMFDRSVLSKSFWLTLFKVDRNDILKICEYSEDFFESIFNFFIYIGSMMEKADLNGKSHWISNPHISICPELSYNNLLSFIKCLSNESFSRKKVTISKIRQAQVNTGSSLWTDIIYNL